jgi:DNA-binding transcriptional LysR family regulator
MNLHALKIFHEVAFHGSVTRAAETLHISQPAVSAQIRKLEQELGLALLAPKGRGILLTETGEIVYRQAQRMVGLVANMNTILHEYTTGITGTVRIASTSLPANCLLPGWIASAPDNQPHSGNAGVQFVITTTNSRTARELLEQYQVDLAFIGGESEGSAALEQHLLLEDEIWFIVPPEHRLAGQHTSLADIMKEPFVMREPGSSMRELLIGLCRVHRLSVPRIALQFNGLNETIRAVIAGCGANLLSALEVREYVKRGDVGRVFVDDVKPVNPISVWTRRQDPLQLAAEHFLKHVRSLSERMI